MNRIRDIDLEGFKKAFDIFDKDGSGSISKEVMKFITKEIATVFKEMKIRLNEKEVEKIMDNFDANHDNSIQFDEFLLVISAYIPAYVDTWKSLSANLGCLRSFKLSIKMEMV